MKRKRKKSVGAIQRVRGGGEAAAPISTLKLKVTPTSRDTARPIAMRREQKGAKLQTYVEETIQHGKITAAGRGGSSYYSPARGCVTKGGKDPVTGKTMRGAPRRGQIDLVFLPRNIPASKHSKRPPPPGPALRFCTEKSGFAPIFPVKDPREAKAVAVAYQRCLKDDPKKPPSACVLKATGKSAEKLAFGGFHNEPKE